MPRLRLVVLAALVLAAGTAPAAVAVPTSGGVEDPAGDPIGVVGAVPDIVRVTAGGDGRRQVRVAVDFAAPLPAEAPANANTRLYLTLADGSLTELGSQAKCSGRVIELQLFVTPSQDAGPFTAYLQRGPTRLLDATSSFAAGGRRMVLSVSSAALDGFTPTCSTGARILANGLPPQGPVPCAYCLPGRRTSPAFLGSEETAGFAITPTPPLTRAEARAAARSRIHRPFRWLACALRGADRARCTLVLRHRRRTIVVTRDLLGAVRATPGASAAAAKPRLLPVARAKWPALSDGRRYVAWETPSQEGVVVTDTQTGRRATVDFPADCRPSEYGQGGLVAVGGGQLLSTCPFAPPPAAPYQLFDLAEKRWHVPVGWDQPDLRPVNTYSYGPTGVGRHWIALRGSGYRAYLVTVFLDWRTGRLVRDFTGLTDLPSPFSATTVPDLDAPEVVRALCKPLARGHDPDYDEERDPYFRPFAIDGRYGLDLGERRLVARRCGDGGKVRLSAKPVWSPQAGGGLVTWKGWDDRLHVFRLGTRRHVVANPPDVESWTVVHTRGDVFLSGRRAPPAPWRVWRLSRTR